MHESELIGLIKRRDEKGAALLLRHYAPLMRYIIAPILQNEQDREECVSEAAMLVWDKIEQFDPSRGSWNAWLTALTRNAALDKVRKNKCVVPSEDVPNEAPSSEPTPEELIVKKEREDAVREALGRLPVQDRALFYRKYYYLQSTAQIASELGMTERAVEGRLYRLKKRLRKTLGGEEHE